MAVEITNQVNSSLNSYFTALSQFGYKKQSDVNKLLIYIFIEELLTGDMRFFVTEEDYKLIEQALSCLYGSSCLMPYPQYSNDANLFGNMPDYSNTGVRITEEKDIRITENDVIRVNASDYNR